MTTYTSNQLLIKFGSAVAALSKKLQKKESDEVNRAWKVVEKAVKAHSKDFEALDEFKSLITYLKTSGYIDPRGDIWKP